ncbi:MAG: triphosphoribosyl-dephospho-CoA synthase [Burkholderiales bacterium]
MLNGSRAPFVAAAVRWACRLDVQAAKPGNVSIASPGHGMRADDFLASAEAVAGPLSAPGRSVGERIAEAVDATWKRVGMNTNLGIVLLAAPLAQAALTARAGETFERATVRVLAELDADDAVHAFRAIVQANPAGLGEVGQCDVRHPAAMMTLLEAMRAAAHRDAIARQYANGFGDVFRFGIPRLLAALRRHGSSTRATVDCYLGWLARFPDTHIARKYGIEVARQVSAEAAHIESGIGGSWAGLRAWDASLKARALNPGTSADLTVASLFAARLQGAFAGRFFEADEPLAPVRKVTWMHGTGLRE